MGRASAGSTGATSSMMWFWSPGRFGYPGFNKTRKIELHSLSPILVSTQTGKNGKWSGWMSVHQFPGADIGIIGFRIGHQVCIEWKLRKGGAVACDHEFFPGPCHGHIGTTYL